MAKLYTLDEKLLIGTPEVRIRDKCYPVDDRQKTVKKIMELTSGDMSGAAAMDKMDDALRLALGAKGFQEIEALELPFAAYQKLFELVIAAVTGEDPEEAARFQQEQGGA